MKLLRWLHKYFFVPGAYHCKPLLSDHVWRAPTYDPRYNEYCQPERYPVCIKCGKQCSWLRGYTMNSGTTLRPDHAALALMAPDDRRLRNIPWNSQP